jgi:hypothetical protein
MYKHHNIAMFHAHSPPSSAHVRAVVKVASELVSFPTYPYSGPCVALATGAGTRWRSAKKAAKLMHPTHIHR